MKSRSSNIIKIWLSAFSLRTLPLATAGIGLGCFLAAAEGAFEWSVALLCLTTAIVLQVLSNLANDYGDSQHGADSRHRKGPKRAVHSGRISKSGMRAALAIFVILATGTPTLDRPPRDPGPPLSFEHLRSFESDGVELSWAFQ